MAEMRKLVLRLDLHDDVDKMKVMKAATSLLGIDSISIDMKNKMLTITGEVDPISVVTKLRKSWKHTDLLFVGPVKEEKKKKEEPSDKDKSTGKDSKDQFAEPLKPWNWNPPMATYYYVQRAEDNHNSCVVL